VKLGAAYGQLPDVGVPPGPLTWKYEPLADCAYMQYVVADRLAALTLTRLDRPLS
jgi:hypothetical protein